MSWKCYLVLFHINIKYRNIDVYGKTHFEIVYFVTSDKKLKFSLVSFHYDLQMRFLHLKTQTRINRNKEITVPRIQQC